MQKSLHKNVFVTKIITETSYFKRGVTKPSIREKAFQNSTLPPLKLSFLGIYQSGKKYPDLFVLESGLCMEGSV